MNIRTIVCTALLLMAGQVWAQRGPGNGRMDDRPYGPKAGAPQELLQNIPDLTPDQQTQIETLMTAHMKEVMPRRNAIREKEARLMSLQTSAEADINQMHTLIEEIGDERTEIRKSRATQYQKVRQALNEDQRVWLDAQMAYKGGKRQRR